MRDTLVDMKSKVAESVQHVSLNPSTSGTLTPQVPLCAVDAQRDGSALVHFRIDPKTYARLKTKCGSRDIQLVLWEDVIHRAVETYCF